MLRFWWHQKKKNNERAAHGDEWSQSYPTEEYGDAWYSAGAGDGESF